MSEQKLTREERVTALIEESGADYNIEALLEDAKNPKKFFVGEYESDELIGLTTVDTLEKAELTIDGNSHKDAQVVDLDTGREHHVSFKSSVER
jgi:hypothetical protein